MLWRSVISFHHPVKDPLVGTIVDDRFELVSVLGRGATSSVYKATRTDNGELVALKILHVHLCQNENLVSRFENEAQTAKILTHPNIVSVNEYAVTSNGTPYLVIDYLDGQSLQELIASHEWLSLSVAVPIFMQICAALNVAHQKGIIHRDLKPGNIILLAQDGDKYLVKILDFGCAMFPPALGETVLKVTQTGEMLGSLLYMSPEQCLEQDVDARSDVYSLGCVLYEALTGKPPLSARTAFETMNKQLSEMPESLSRVRPDLVFPKSLEKIIFKAMAKSPTRRYQKISELMDELSTILEAHSEMDAAKSKKNQHLQASKEKKLVVSVKSKLNIKIKMDDVLLCRYKGQSYWSVYVIALLFEFLNFYPQLVVVVSAWTILLLIVEIYSPLKTSSEIEQKIESLPNLFKPSSSAVRGVHEGDFKGRIAHLPPLAKMDVFVHDAKASFTYTSGTALISLKVSTARSSLFSEHEIVVRPVFARSFFWATLCEQAKEKKDAGGKLCMPAYITRTADGNWSVIVINAQQATIVEVVNEEVQEQTGNVI